jgi:hypothetical protein
MFIAKFQLVNNKNDKFTADKNGNLPFIGTVLAGTSKGSIINGTMFEQQGLKENVLYACENSVDPEYPDNVRTEIVSEVSLLEYSKLRTQLGNPASVTATKAEAVEATA